MLDLWLWLAEVLLHGRLLNMYLYLLFIFLCFAYSFLFILQSFVKMASFKTLVQSNELQFDFYAFKGN